MTTNIKFAKQIKKKPDSGHYSLGCEELDWISCRENFAKIFNQNQKGLFFSHEPSYEERISSFIEKTEEILVRAALQNINKSKFYKTNLNFATWIEPSSFWMKCPMKRSLFTMLLRCGSFYNFKNYEEALYSIQYSQSTKKALQRFLYGFTEFQLKNESFEGIGKGWVSYFANKDCNVICEKLKPPADCLSDVKFLFGEEVLWA
jgi:hypothetical protein